MSSRMRLFLNRLGWALAALTLALAQAGCAGLHEVTSKVASYGSWPEGRQPGAYVFERLPSQQNRAEAQTKLEAAAEPALAAAGFRKVDDATRADVTVQVGAQTLVDERGRYEPWGPYRPYYGPWRPGWGGWWGSGGRGGFGISMAMEPPWTQMQVDLLIRDRRNNQVLYETHAVHERLGSPIDELYPFLFQAALKDFPHQAVSPRMVTVPVPDAER
ncbi:MAG: DUF4136 domain-containing protein [Aquabacterium sp.]